MGSGSHHEASGPSELALIEIAPLRADPSMTSNAAIEVASRIDASCRTLGFFRITGHGIPDELFDRLDRASRAFFARPDEEKAAIAMEHAGAAWRGWFPVRGEITSGRPDRKEGLYVGEEHGPDHPRVVDRTPLHGTNLFPDGELGPLIVEWMAEVRRVADVLMRAIATGLGLPPAWFESHLTAEPTQLFRVFHYPAFADNATSDEWGVGEHTDYGILTVLAQDRLGGLEVRTPDGDWIDVPADPYVLVCNIGDMLDKLTEGRYRSTPHRARNTSGAGRLSFPYFFDPSWDAEVVPLPFADEAPTDDVARRWDSASVHAWTGRYGDYLTAKVARVFPALFAAVGSETLAVSTDPG